MICSLRAETGFQEVLTLQIFHIPVELFHLAPLVETPSNFVPDKKLLITDKKLSVSCIRMDSKEEIWVGISI
jgi:hypothetical protein